MRNWSISAGRIFGVELRIHPTFLLLLIFVLVTESAAAGASGAARGMALVAIIFGSVILHELGHALVAAHSGIKVRSILLLPIGGMTLTEHSSSDPATNPSREMRVALAGPAVNLAISLVTASLLTSVAPEISLWTRPHLQSANLLRSLVWANIYLGLFNLLPAYPMDGGRVLRAMLAKRMPEHRATRRAVAIGQLFAMLFILAGIWNTWLMLTGVFLFFAAQLEERSLLFQSVVETVRMEDIMLTDFSTLSPADTLEDALAKAVHSLQDDFPVIRGSDMVGVISRQRILEALRREGNAYVQSVMSKAFEVAHKSESLASAFRKISSRGLTIIPVVDDNHLVGIVTLQNLMHSMGLLAESRKLQRNLETPGG